jgi:hypothetical protein
MTSTPEPVPATTTGDAPARAAGRGWAYTGTVLGAVTSVAANIAHTYVPPTTGPVPAPWTPEAGAVIGAVFWPLALLVASETLARKRWATTATRVMGIAAVLLVGAVAAVISYQHLHALLLHYGETHLAAAIGPLAVDGLMIVSSLALVARDAPTTNTDATIDATPETEPAPSEADPIEADPIEADPIESTPVEPDRVVADPINGSRRNGHPHPIGSPAGAPEPIGVSRGPILDITGSVPRSIDRPAMQGADRETRSATPTARPADVQRAREAIRAQVLPDRPTAEAIRRHLGISPAYARATRDALAHTVTTT